MYTGPHIIKDGLVFGYDTGYGIADNDTATRFYPGRPTDNLNADPYHSTRSAGDTINLSAWGGDTGQGSFEVNTSPPGGGMMFINHNTSNPEGSGGTYTDFPSTRYTLTNGVTYTRSWWAKADDERSASGHICSCNRDSTNTYIVGSTVSLKTYWQRYTHTFTYTGPTSNDWQFRHIIYDASKVYIANVQLEVSSVASPFVSGTRSSTASLIDLKETTDIDVSNVSFDSTGQPDFDGTSDFMVLGDFDLRPGFTLEAVCFAHTSSFALWGQGPTITSRGLHIIATGGTRGFVFGMYGNDCDYRNYAPATNTWHHWVFTYDGTTFQKKFIADGVAQTPVVLTVENEWLEGESPLRLGINYGSGTSYSKANGAIAVAKVYNRPLSATEIKQNYNAYKNRFDI